MKDSSPEPPRFHSRIVTPVYSEKEVAGSSVKVKPPLEPLVLVVVGLRMMVANREGRWDT